MRVINRIKSNRIYRIICLLLMVGILCITYKTEAHATVINDEGLGTHIDAGTTDNRTYINEPGSSENADDLKELNIANQVTITYDNGNGQLNGALRILCNL